MTALTLRLPEDKHRRLKALARQRGVSINRLLDEAATLLLAEFDAETRFQLRAERGQGRGVERGLALISLFEWRMANLFWRMGERLAKPGVVPCG